MSQRHRPHPTGHPARFAMSAAFWLLLLAIWLGGLLLGLWRVWPLFRAATLDLELVAAGMWLIIGVAAWLPALNFRWQRYPRR